MQLDDYQAKAVQTAIYPLLKDMDISQDVNPYYPALGLAGEVGEFCNKLKKVMRDNNGRFTEEFRSTAKGELGDILWYLSALATELGFSLEEIAEENISKLFRRKAMGKLKGSGDDR